jgi:hypothetical protein
LAAPTPVHGRPPVLLARRGGDAPSFFFLPFSPFSSSCPSSLGGGTGEWENPNAVGGRPAGARSRGVGVGSRAAQGQRCRSAQGLGAWAEMATWRPLCGRRSPWWRGSGGKGGLFPLGASLGGHTHVQLLGVRSGQAVRPSHRTHARARSGPHTPARRSNRCGGKRIRESDRWGRLVIETGKNEDSGRWAAVRWCWVGPAIGHTPRVPIQGRMKTDSY